MINESSYRSRNKLKHTQRLAALSPAKRALFERRLRGVLTGVAKSCVIPRRPDQNKFPLTFAQERLWFLAQLDPNNSAYNRSVALRIKGSLDITILKMSLNEIFRRHEVLRATFSSVEGWPAQSINPVQPVHLSVKDLSELSPNERESQAIRMVTEETQRPFDLSQGPLLRAMLLRLDQVKHILHIVIHHIAFDAWSAKVLIKELTELYEAFFRGMAYPLPELPIQYADFAHWQRQRLCSEVLEPQLAFWKKKLDGAPPGIELPTDRPRPSIQTSCGALQSMVISASMVQSLNDLGLQEGVTLFMSLLAAFQILLHRYTGQNDINLGTFSANRTQTETEGLIGFFINTLVLRADLSGNPTFLEYLFRVREMALEAYAHQDLPFEKLVEGLQPVRDLSRTPLFQVVFNLEIIPQEPMQTKSLKIEEFEFDTGVASFDLTLEIISEGEGLNCLIKYNTDLFDENTVKRMLIHYQTLLKDIIANPAKHISELSLLTESEQRQLLVTWNDTQADYPDNLCIHQIFEAQVEQSPNSVAVVNEAKQLTYIELNRRANQLANYLKKNGVGPEVLVAIYVERSLEMIIGLLGILKAGGVYVPLDSNYPKKRVAYMLEDTQVSVLLTQQRLVRHLPEHRARTICLDADWQTISQENDKNPVCEVTASNRAYVIYTSGSTGMPKGVMIEHRSLVNYTNAAVAEFAISASDRVLQFASISFDAAAEEIFPCLVCGATLVLRTDSMLDSLPAFLQDCQERELTVLDLPTAYWSSLTVLINSESLKFPSSVRLMIIGGERALPEQIIMWRNSVGHSVRLINTYGPTEATIVATMCDLSDLIETDNDLQVVPIGRPIFNVQVYVLDRFLQPVPAGVWGELYISGVGLARGYLNHPELTDTMFISNPFSEESGSRIYKTGDLVRYLPNGHIEFRKRLDRQVKIRGFRIELEEIEAALGQHPAVNHTAVLARQELDGDKRLIAYIVLNHKATPILNELRNFLREILPDYMIPSAFVFLDFIPLTTSGKVNYNGLPAPDQIPSNLEGHFEKPHTQVESIIALVWQELLNVEQVSVYDNFFDIGGHSLLVMQAIAKLEKKLGVKLNPRDFILQTLGQIASMCEEKIKLSSRSEYKNFSHKLWPNIKEKLLSKIFHNK